MYRPQANLLDAVHTEDMHLSVTDWQVPDLPDLDGFDELFMDLESTGLRWWDQDVMIGMGLLTPDGIARYFPIRHKVGPNIPKDVFFAWVRRAFRFKRIVNAKLKFDLHLLRNEGIDLEAQGCTFGDVAHAAALIDDHRRRFNQAELMEDFLGEPDGKVVSVNGYVLDMGRLAQYPAGLVAPRAMSDVRGVKRLMDVMWPLLTKENLHDVRKLEDSVIPVVVEMEHNGVRLDVERLNDWVIRSKRDMEAAMWDVQRLTGCSMTTPNKRDEITKIFNTLRIEIPRDPETGEPSFADNLLEGIEHEAIQRLRAGIQLASLQSKFLIPYQKCVARDGILRYELHQLPYQKDDKSKAGAVSGRFSSSAITYFDDRGVRCKEGANIQQVFGVTTQLDPHPITKVPRGYTREYIVKKLFIPPPGEHWLSSDASQLQFRIFSDYSGSEDIIAAYQDDLGRAERGEPLADYHDIVSDLIKTKAGKILTRTHTKNVNFAQVFGAGIRKMASQLGVPAEQIPDTGQPIESGGPEFQKVVEISETYHTMFPGVKPLLQLTAHLAMPSHRKPNANGKGGCGKQCRELYRQGYTHRGYVRTRMGRRARFKEMDRFYSALNRIIQGTEGDVNKKVLVAIHNRRHELGLTACFTVHDAWDGYMKDKGLFTKVREAFNTQYMDFKVPILWKMGIGPNWAEAE